MDCTSGGTGGFLSTDLLADLRIWTCVVSQSPLVPNLFLTLDCVADLSYPLGCPWMSLLQIIASSRLTFVSLRAYHLKDNTSPCETSVSEHVVAPHLALFVLHVTDQIPSLKPRRLTRLATLAIETPHLIFRPIATHTP
ncbi:hypothetical protein BJ912DRAFT_1067890 [Pholiota molesta]|nr:hypothetical protein BJ912DRAFT_1072095 [Pholiota molesta]KAF8166503.1 hypothetical protein BJ912DRAFT_1067889 [Pholiota molesta]KAF8166504.1 hypothetical protein BJ912DRAFT_1067890 [Pholiota molesta]